MNVKPYKGQIPFTDKEPLSYAGTKTDPLTRWPPWDPNGALVTWRDNNPFEDELTWRGLHTCYRGAKRAVWYSPVLDADVQMFMSSLNDAMQYVNHGKLRGTFAFIKRGQNICIARIG